MENIPIKQGKFLERATLGDTKYEGRIEREELERKRKNMKMFSSVTAREGFILAERMQPWKNPSQPEKTFPKELRNYLITKLKIRGLIDLQEDDVKYFTSVGCSPLDDHLGIDAYFKVMMPDGERIVTMDITLMDKKAAGKKTKADIVFQVDDRFEQGSKEWNETVSSVGKNITEKLMSNEELQMEENEIMNKRVSAIPIEKQKKYIIEKY
jgi:hypothetical protein